ncbi:uncharacterized protein MYCFIDRAFT_178463 [Pseudocercospora fijiensis CIRAD86]|uniref:Uncharacterized protein n=1 Tax=Pseudocercospora fijiensis (strain CIRAD86) TaxID=383855 RepID=M3ALK2_PSEFD|nr:uncharacterized protein MYCFIDRAFT_178463 [Pseudocercospora fijiensis CIRAD86]EME78312.1 hypothetical protein MYCFIDRAFT_178463 [Pseudocercospora fijiensis CIRAD86]
MMPSCAVHGQGSAHLACPRASLLFRISVPGLSSLWSDIPNSTPSIDNMTRSRTSPRAAKLSSRSLTWKAVAENGLPTIRTYGISLLRAQVSLCHRQAKNASPWPGCCIFRARITTRLRRHARMLRGKKLTKADCRSLPMNAAEQRNPLTTTFHFFFRPVPNNPELKPLAPCERVFDSCSEDMPLKAPTKLVLKEVHPQVQGLALRMYDGCSMEERRILRRQLLTLHREFLDAEIGSSKVRGRFMISSMVGATVIEREASPSNEAFWTLDTFTASLHMLGLETCNLWGLLRFQKTKKLKCTGNKPFDSIHASNASAGAHPSGVNLQSTPEDSFRDNCNLRARERAPSYLQSSGLDICFPAIG